MDIETVTWGRLMEWRALTATLLAAYQPDPVRAPDPLRQSLVVVAEEAIRSSDLALELENQPGAELCIAELHRAAALVLAQLAVRRQPIDGFILDRYDELFRNLLGAKTS